MIKVVRIFVWAVVAALSTAAMGLAPLYAKAIEPEMLDSLPPADVVILGEVHDNPAHHLNQTRAVAALQPKALVFEMLTPDLAQLVSPALRSDEQALAAALGWAELGWPDFAMYYPIFLAAPDAPVFGGAVPREDVRRAMTVGAGAVFGDAARKYGLDADLDPNEQALREVEQMTAHCDALSVAMIPGMVSAQRLRDAALARAALQAFDATGGPVVVITGSGHADRLRGIPVALAHAAPDLRVLSVGQLESDPGKDAPFDLWLVTDPHPRPDPCAASR
ncbi:MAG: ChaN family lipoprotein [Gemmobacter sp.]|nr:ChaN family lipoprotein [Gemmobacter sp.]